MRFAVIVACVFSTSLAPGFALGQVDRSLTLGTTQQKRVEFLPPDEELRKREVSASVTELVANLGAAEFAKRDDAMAKLRGDDIVLDDLIALLAKRNLSAEQQHRLVTLVSERILTQFGALGVTMDTRRREADGVLITGCVPGMPAEKFLQPDDLVVAIDGRAVTNSDSVTAIVQALAPGTKVRIEFIRTERDAVGKPRLDANSRPITKRIEATFPLGSSRDLQRASMNGLSLVHISVERTEMAREVVLRYAPQPILVLMPGDHDDTRRYTALDTDKQEDVKLLKDLKERYQREIHPWDAGTMDTLQNTLQKLRRQAQDPSYPAAQREWFARVAKRYEELMPKVE